MSFFIFFKIWIKFKTKEELKIQNFDTGSFMHEVIDLFFNYLREENIKLTELLNEEEKIRKIVNQIIETKLDCGKI